MQITLTLASKPLLLFDNCKQFLVYRWLLKLFRHVQKLHLPRVKVYNLEYDDLADDAHRTSVFKHRIVIAWSTPKDVIRAIRRGRNLTLVHKSECSGLVAHFAEV